MKNQWEWQVIDEAKSYPDNILARGEFKEGSIWDAQGKMERLFPLIDDYDDLEARFGDDVNLGGEWIEELNDPGDYSRSCSMRLNGFILNLFTMNYDYDPWN